MCLKYREITFIPNISRKNDTGIYAFEKIKQNGSLASVAELTKIESFIIQRVKELRIKNGLTQIELSQRMGMSDSFIGHIETPKRVHKYKIAHLNELAKIFKCSPKDFWPDKPL